MEDEKYWNATTAKLWDKSEEEKKEIISNLENIFKLMENTSQPKVHKLKIWPEHYHDQLYDRKRFELRFNDRDFKVGDLIILEEFDPVKSKYTGRSSLPKEIVYMLEKHEGLKEGYCILGTEYSKPIRPSNE